MTAPWRTPAPVVAAALVRRLRGRWFRLVALCLAIAAGAASAIAGLAAGGP